MAACSFADARSLVRTLTCVAVGSCVLAFLGTGQRDLAARQQQPGEPRPSFDASVNLVLVDLRVERGRAPVTDLRPEEVTLLVDGVPRPIVSLIYAPVVVASGAARDGGALTGSAPAPASLTPPRAPSRRVVFVVDRESLDAGEARQLQTTAETFLRGLPADIGVAVAVLPLGPGIRFDPDRQATVAALRSAFEGTTRRGAGIEGIAGFGCAGAAASDGCGEQGLPDIDPRARKMNLAAEWTIRGRRTLNDLQWLFRALAGGPADVVILSGALPFHERLRADVDRTFTVARTAGVSVHAVEIADLTHVALLEGGESTTLTLESLRERHPAAYGLPEETGGVASVGSVSGTNFFAQLARELSSTYLLSFEPTPADRDGRPHRIEVRLSRRPQPTVHARRTFAMSVGEPSPVPVAADNGRGVATTTSVPAPPARDHVGDDAPVGASGGHAIPLALVMQRAASYVGEFERALSHLVAEERYVQVVKRWTGVRPEPAEEPDLGWRSGTNARAAHDAGSAIGRRQLLSDVLFVQAPGQAWLGYRDVAEVDGAPVRDRALRVEKLFLSGSPDARKQLRRIADESARYNLGSARNINVPTFPLQIFRAGNLPKFEWTTEGQRRSAADPTACAVVGFREVAATTIVRTDGGSNVPMTGQACIEPDTGRVWRVTLRFHERAANVEGAFQVVFRPGGDASVLLPESAWEWSLAGSTAQPSFVEGQATYSNVRRFSVSTEERLR